MDKFGQPISLNFQNSMFRGNKIKTHFGGGVTVLILTGLLALYATQLNLMI